MKVKKRLPLNEICIALDPCRYIFLMFLVGFVALVSQEQGSDILRALLFSENISKQAMLLYLATVIWSIQSWLGCRWMLYTSELLLHGNPEENNEKKEYYLKLISGIASAIPFIILLIAIIVAILNTSSKHLDFYLVFHLVMCLGLGLFTVVSLNFVGKKEEHLNLNLVDRIKIKDIPTITLRLAIGSLIVFVFFNLFMIFIPVSFSQLLGSAAIIILAFSLWLTLIYFFIGAFNLNRVPFLILVLIWTVLISPLNYNHSVRLLPNDIPSRPSVTEHFEQWCNHNSRCKTKAKFPVFIVAVEGGGLRSGYWAANVLAEIQDRSNKQFGDHLYAISTVSGGTLGAAVFEGLLHEDRNNHCSIENYREYTKTILANDSLSPLIGRLSFIDLVARLLPLSLSFADRATALEESWEDGWNSQIKKSKSCLNKKLFSESFYQLWYHGTTQFTDYNTPLFILNGTHVETGKRAIVSPVKLTNISTQQDNGFDLSQIIQKDIRLSTAVLLTARFPYVTPTGRIHSPKSDQVQEGSKDQKPAILKLIDSLLSLFLDQEPFCSFWNRCDVWGHVADGGYFENSGVATSIDLVTELQPVIKEKFPNVELHVIVIRNSEITDPIYTQNNELLDPPLTLINARTARTPYSLALLENFILGEKRKVKEKKASNVTSNVIQVNMCLSGYDVPLGWFLSKKARENVDKYIEDDDDQKGTCNVKIRTEIDKINNIMNTK